MRNQVIRVMEVLSFILSRLDHCNSTHSPKTPSFTSQEFKTHHWTALFLGYCLKSSAGTFAVIHKSRMMTKGDWDFGLRKPLNLNDLLEEARLAGSANSLKCFLKVHFYRKTVFATLLKNVTLSPVVHY